MNALTQLELNALRLLYRSGIESRKGIAQALGIRSTTTSDMISGLIMRGLVVEKGALSTRRGRYPTGLSLNPQYGSIVGIELTNAYLRGVVIDFAGSVLGRIEQPLTSPLTVEVIADNLESLVEQLSEKCPDSNLLGCGLAVYGLVDHNSGVAVNLPPFNLQNVPLSNILERRIKVPVVLETRTYAAAIAEMNHGLGDYDSLFLCINADHGAALGLACVDNGHIIRGQGFAGQFGHLCVDPGGARCFCGGRGCLATIATPAAIVEQTLRDLHPEVQSVLNQIVRDKGDKLSFNDIVAAATQKDKLAVDIMSKLARYLGLGISYVVNLFNPHKIILGGLLKDVGPDFVDQLGTEVERHVIQGVFAKGLIQTTTMDIYGPALGAADVAVERIIEQLDTLSKRETGGG